MNCQKKQFLRTTITYLLRSDPRANLKLVLFLAGGLLFGDGSLVPSAGADDSPIQIRRGISNFFILLDQKQQAPARTFTDALPVVEGSGNYDFPQYQYRFFERIQELYPNQYTGGQMTFVGSGAPGSLYGTYRVVKAAPTIMTCPQSGGRIIFVDFSQSDLDKTEQQVIDAVEGITRQAWIELDMVYVYSSTPEFIDDYLAGKTPKVIQWYDKIARHYDIPTVNLALNAAQKIKAGVLTKEQYFTDRLKRESAGVKIDAEEFARFLDEAYKARRKEGGVINRTHPDVYSKTQLADAGIYPYEFGEYNNDAWHEGIKSVIPSLRHMLVGSTPGAEFVYPFSGLAVGLLDVLAADSADLEVALDDGPWKRISAAEGNKLEAPKQRVLLNLFDGLDRNAKHRLRVRVAKDQPASKTPRTARIGAVLVGNYVHPFYEGYQPLERIEAIYQKMQPVQYAPPADRWKAIPKTMNKLRNGDSLCITMLGDSIMDDSANSRYELVLQQLYPKCKVKRVTACWGGTGCWRYKKDNLVKTFALKENPDLLVIGGISQRDDIDSIRDVIHQARALKPELEFMLITPVMGSELDPFNKFWTLEIDAEKYPYRANLKKLAEEEHCELLDLTGVCRKYMMDSGRCVGWFMRDGVHANERGSQVIGRHIVEYFRPKN